MRAEGCGFAFDGVSHPVEINHVRQIELQSKTACNSRAGDDKALFAQPRYSFSNRRARYAEGGGYLIGVELCAGANAQIDYVILYELFDEVFELCVGVGFNILRKLMFIHYHHRKSILFYSK